MERLAVIRAAPSSSLSQRLTAVLRSGGLLRLSPAADQRSRSRAKITPAIRAHDFDRVRLAVME